MGERADGITPDEITPFDDMVETTEMTDGDEKPEAEEIRAEIEQTRADMSQTIDAIQEKLSPANLKEQAKETIHEATIGKAQHLAQTAGELAHTASGKVSEIAKPAAAKVSEIAGPAATRAGEVAGPAAAAVKQAAQSAGAKAKAAGATLKSRSPVVMDTVKRYPLPAAVAAVGLAWLVLRNLGRGAADEPDDEYPE